MIAPLQIIPEPDLLPGGRLLLSWYPELAGYPERLAEELEVEEHDVRACLEVLELEGWLCP
jgi:hypothetical protein